MTGAGVDATAIEVFSHYYRQLEHGETGLIPEDTIDPLDMEALADVEVSGRRRARRRSARTVVIKLNGGLGTSMGMDRAKSLLPVRRRPDVPRHHRPAGAARAARSTARRCR